MATDYQKVMTDKGSKIYYKLHNVAPPPPLKLKRDKKEKDACKYVGCL